jgi:hypothetical protein
MTKKEMKIYHVSCNDGFKDKGDYDEYSDAVILAESEEQAKEYAVKNYYWEDTKNVDVVYIGEASSEIIELYTTKDKLGEICASYHAG